MAIALDADLGSAEWGNTTGTVTYTTIAAAASLARVVVMLSYFSGTSLVSAVSVGGNALAMDKRTTNGSDYFEVWSAHIAGGVTSGATVSINRGLSGLGAMLASAVSFTGVLSSGALVTTSSSTSTGTAWSSGAATNTGFADAVYVGGAGNEDPTAGTSSTPTAGTEIHDRYRLADGQGIATGYLIVSSVASRALTGNWSNANSTANTGALAIYAGSGGGGGGVTVKQLAAMGVG